MKHEKIEAAPKDGPECLLGGDKGSYKGKPAKRQEPATVLRQYVTGFKAPIHLLAERGGDPPAIWIDRYPDKVIVGMANRPWGWSNPTQEFLDVTSAAAETYALSLGRKLVHAANTKAADIARRREARWRERMGLPLDWEGGK